MSLLERQSNLFNFIDQQIDQQKIAHAYLLVGENDTTDSAYIMAQRFMCPQRGCSTCDVCQRIINHEHGDFIFLSGKESIIKKEEVELIKQQFNQTSLENSPYKIYVIEDVDNASIVAMNSFLKFLEEPDSNIIAILTTSNINRVLETIKSRCLIFHLDAIDKTVLKESLEKMGFETQTAQLLSQMSNNVKEAKAIANQPLFNVVLDTFNEMKVYYDQNRYQEAGIYLQVQGIKKHRFDLDAMRLFLNLHKRPFIDDLSLMKLALETEDKIRPGVITSLLIDQFVYELSKL